VKGVASCPRAQPAWLAPQCQQLTPAAIAILCPTCCLCAKGDVGLEIAPDNKIESLSLIEDVGNISRRPRVAPTGPQVSGS
jgi:hypothetical protein